MLRSASARGAGASPWLAGVRILTSACGIAWVVREWDALPQPVLALVGLAAVAASALFCWRPPARARGLAEAATVGVVALLLVGLNGGAESALVALWLSVLAGICLALPPHVRVQLPTLFASGAAVGIHPGTTALPLLLGGGAVAAGSFVASRRYAQALDRAQVESLQDPLTGLPNRRALDHRLALLAAAPSPALALLWIDLDGFRHINKDHGYATGDRALVEAAQVLWRAAPAGSFPARLGGDEFAIVLEHRRHARELADLVIDELSAATIEGTTLEASIGIAYLPEHGPTLDHLRAGADQALRWAKQSGKGIAVEFDPAKQVEHTRPPHDDVRRLWEEELIDIVVQPIVDVQYGRVRSYEALARFRVDGDPSPLTWFSRAEAQGLRVELELACLERALRLLSSRPRGTRLSVNASPELLTHPAARSLLMEVSSPDALVLEVTENAVVEDYEHLKEILAPLVERGMTLAVDDFGAGAANMRHVDALAPSYLKLDRTLVADIASDPRKSAMVEALVRYTWKTDSQLVAEGVETTADLEHLRRLGVGAAQGFVIARPQPPWPMVELPALAVMRQGFAPRGRLPSIICQSDALTAAEARDLFDRDAQLTAIALVDGTERVRALLARNRLLGADSADGQALRLADTDPLLVRPGTARAEIVSLAMAREVATRYDPILVVDEAWRLIEAVTIDELLQESAAPAPERASGDGPLRLAAER